MSSRATCAKCGAKFITCNENSAYVMPHFTAHAVTPCIVQCPHTGKPAALCIHGTPEITYGHAVRASQVIFIKINCLTFCNPKYKNCKPEHAEKDSHYHAQPEQGRLQ